MKIPLKYYLFLIIGILLLVVLEYFKPQPVDWSKTFSSKDKIPFGTEALYRMLPDMFPENSIDRNEKSFYTLDWEYISNVLIVAVANEIEYDRPSLNKLLQSVSGGSDLFLSAYNIDRNLLDTLGLKLVDQPYQWKREPQKIKAYNENALIDTISKVPVLRKMSTLRIKRDSIFSKTRLGFIEDSLNFVKVSMGLGNIYIHTEPMAFSNYYFLKGNTYDYVETIFKKLESKKLVWDHYHNALLLQNQTPLKVILKHKSLKYSYYIVIALLVLYLLLAGRRVQRPIPVLEKPVNTSVDFIHTISNLYLGSKNHKAIAQHRIRSFKNFLKDHFFINWKMNREEIIQKLGNKSGLGEKKAGEILNFIHEIENKKQISQKELIHLNNLIENFTNKYYGQ
jgi:hypothetical protein